jgi:hypothetical protein
MKTDQTGAPIDVKNDLNVNVVRPKEVRLDEEEDFFIKDLDRGLGMPRQEGERVYLPPRGEVKQGVRLAGRMGAPIAALMFGLLIGAFVLYNLWAAGEFDGRIAGVLAIWGVSFSTVVWLLVRTP